GAVAVRLRERHYGGVVAGFEVSGRVLDLDGQRARRAGREVGRRAREGQVVGPACDGIGGDGERRRVGGERVGAGGDRERAGERAADGLRSDAAGRGCGAEPTDAAGAARLGEADRGGVVAALEVAGGVADLGGERACVPGGEVGGRA